jgi:chromosomal replication initiator protein
LCIDDLQLGRGSGTLETLFSLIKSLVEPESEKKSPGQIIITMNCPLSELTARLPKPWMASLLQKGTFEVLEPPDETAQIEIMRSMVVAWDPEIKIADEALKLIAQSTEDGDGRNLEGLLNHARLYADQDHKIIDEGVIRRILAKREGKILLSGCEKKITGEMIIETIRSHYHLNVGDIEGRRREGPIVLARQVVMWLCKQHTKLTPDEIGQLLKKDRTTALYGIGAITKKMEDPTVAENITAIELRLGLVPSNKQ